MREDEIKTSVLEKVLKLIGFAAVLFSTIFGAVSFLLSILDKNPDLFNNPEFTQNLTDFLGRFSGTIFGNGLFLLIVLLAGFIVLVWGIGKTRVGRIIYTVLVLGIIGYLFYRLWEIPWNDLKGASVNQFVSLILARVTLADPKVFWVSFLVPFLGVLLLIILTWIGIRSNKPKSATIIIRFFGFITLILATIAYGLLVLTTRANLIIATGGESNVLFDWLSNITEDIVEQVLKYTEYVITGSLAITAVGSLFGVIFFWRNH
ncbi:MAG: hypothetical protein LBV55_02285 [Acholeplasmatales bacterium]|jgi:hypothetical protein|nr:hypothetical protein [Acholeplasmatales bacterium]